MAQANRMQERQDESPAEFIVQGVDDWRECLSVTVKLTGGWSALCGSSEVPYIEYARKEAEVNNQSLERSIFIALIRLGYQLEGLEVEIDTKDAKDWGRAVWYKEHANYEESIPDFFAKMNLESRLYHATWKTEHAGDQRYCMYSTQMLFSGGWLPHKTLIFRRVVFSPPQSAEQAAA